jgi:sirohydrochlorin cobaltochelatase
VHSFEAVVLVGHGGIASDTPPELVAELKQLEGMRHRAGETQPGAREAELDRRVREWPRTPASDPYKAGLEAIAEKLGPRLGERRLEIAYNEFCAPSLRTAIERLAAEGATRITVVTTMFTPGGSHSEREMPAEIEQIRREHPGIRIEYAWPYALDMIAEFLATHLAGSPRTR